MCAKILSLKKFLDLSVKGISGIFRLLMNWHPFLYLAPKVRMSQLMCTEYYSMFQENIQDTPIAAPHGPFRGNKYQEPEVVSCVIPTQLTVRE